MADAGIDGLCQVDHDKGKVTHRRNLSPMEANVDHHRRKDRAKPSRSVKNEGKAPYRRSRTVSLNDVLCGFRES